MPLYRFHFHDGHDDEQGQDLPYDATAPREAITALCDIAKEQVPRNGDNLDLSIHVTDAAGCALFSAVLNFRVDAVAKPPPERR